MHLGEHTLINHRYVCVLMTSNLGWINISMRDSYNGEELQECFLRKKKVDFHTWFLFKAEVTATQFILSCQKEICSLAN